MTAIQLPACAAGQDRPGGVNHAYSRLDPAREKRGNGAPPDTKARPMITLDQLEAAAALVHGIMKPTPQICWPLLGERCGAEVWVKHENHTPIGAFKLRGGLNYMA